MLDKESLIERCPRVAELDDSALERLNLMIGYVEESVGIDHLVNSYGLFDISNHQIESL